MKALEELSRQKTAFDKKFEEDGKAALEAGFAEFFAANPGIAAVRWLQFTVDVVDMEDPNDGVDDPTFKLVEDDVEKDEDEEEEENEDAEDDDDDGFLAVEEIVDPALRRACKILAGQLTGHDDLFYALFDTAVEVTVTREGSFEVAELETE